MEYCKKSIVPLEANTTWKDHRVVAQIFSSKEEGAIKKCISNQHGRTNRWSRREKLGKRWTDHGVSQVFGGVVRYVEQLAVLRHHHQEAVQRLQCMQIWAENQERVESQSEFTKRHRTRAVAVCKFTGPQTRETAVDQSHLNVLEPEQ